MMKDCFIFDIDGTVADNKHRAIHLEGRPKRWDLYNATMADDPPINHIVEVAKSIKSAGGTIVFCTGREEPFREITQAWLNNVMPFFEGLYMRAEKDYRPDEIVKLELLNRIKADGFNPLMAFEDRNKVVAMWRSNGVPCAQVAPGDF